MCSHVSGAERAQVSLTRRNRTESRVIAEESWFEQGQSGCIAGHCNIRRIGITAESFGRRSFQRRNAYAALGCQYFFFLRGSSPFPMFLVHYGLPEFSLVVRERGRGFDIMLHLLAGCERPRTLFGAKASMRCFLGVFWARGKGVCRLFLRACA